MYYDYNRQKYFLGKFNSNKLIHLESSGDFNPELLTVHLAHSKHVVGMNGCMEAHSFFEG